MMSDRWVAITAVICATLFSIAALGGMLYLVATGNSGEVFGALAIGLLTVVYGKMRSMQETMRTTNVPPSQD